VNTVYGLPEGPVRVVARVMEMRTIAAAVVG
jgi:hypothetical protein